MTLPRVQKLMEAAKSATPGPWRASSMVMDAKDWAALNPKKGSLDIVQRGQDVIAAVWCGDDRDGEEAANSKLIAACSPEFIQALCRVVEASQRIPGALQAMYDGQDKERVDKGSVGSQHRDKFEADIAALDEALTALEKLP